MVEIYLNFSETFFEFIVKASMGISRNKHELAASDLTKKSMSFTLSFRAISRPEQF